MKTIAGERAEDMERQMRPAKPDSMEGLVAQLFELHSLGCVTFGDVPWWNPAPSAHWLLD
jgi:hypothetical protein